MKKLLLTILFTLVLSGGANADEKIDKALEKCADTQIFLGNLKDIDKSYYENNEIYKIMLSDKYAFQSIRDEAGETFTKSYKQYWEDNPRPSYPTRENIANYNFDDYRKASDEYEKKETAYLKPFKDKMLKAEEVLKKQEQLLKEATQIIIRDKLLTMGLNEKAKTIPNYTKKFTLCEEAYSKTPKGFMLEWSQ